MKRIITILLVCAVLLTGCGNTGVSQEEYDKVVAERDELREEVEKNKSWYENAIDILKNDARNTKEIIEEDYNSCINYVKNNIDSKNQESIISYIDEIYSVY